LLALSFPKFGHPACAWLALAPLVVAVVRTGAPRRAFFFGLTCGAVYFAGTLYWLVQTMTTFGGLATPVAAFAALLLVAYLSLFPGAFAAILSWLTRRGGLRALALAPPIWVTTELGRQYVWDGFPWTLLGYSQVTVLPIAQLASVAGVYGLSFLLALTATAAAALLIERNRNTWMLGGATVAIVVGLAVWGTARIDQGTLTTAGDPVRVAVVQGNIAQEEKWQPALRDAIADRYLTMTRQAIAQGATFIIWPESSTPFFFERDLVRGGEIRRLARENGVTLLIGSDQVEPIKAEPGIERPQVRLYNAAFLIKPDGQVGAVYRKMHLVPFGEYVPAKALLFFAGKIVEAVSDFSAGTDHVLLPVGNHLASTAICYEVIYGSLMRQFVVSGSELLTTITNDAWYGRSSAAYQHWEQATMRAIEGGRYLARAANTGISGFVDPYGRVLDATDLFEQALVVRDIRFLRERTVYSRIGDLIAWLSLGLVALALLAARRLR
jgi:apolipoprotein N-acyltransferase